MKTLIPVESKISTELILEGIIWRQFKKIYNKIMNDTEKLMLNRIQTALEKAIINNKVRFIDNRFFGSFTKEVAKEIRDLGGVYNTVSKTYKMPNGTLKGNIISAIQTADLKNKQKATRLIENINKINLDDFVIDDSEYKEFFQKVLKTTTSEVKKSFKKANYQVGVSQTYTEAELLQIAKEYTENTQLYVKNFLQDEINLMRKEVWQNVESGKRARNLEGFLQERFDVGKRKAKFLARQETSLCVNAQKRTLYDRADVVSYIWQTSEDNRVRHDHKELDGKIFTYNQKAVVNKLTGKKANPGEDWNCRCVDRPIIK